MSASVMREEVLAALDAGADEYVTKPFSAACLRAVLERSSRLRALHIASPPNLQAQRKRGRAATAEVLATEHLLNISELGRRGTALSDLVRSFEAQLEQALPVLRDAASRGQLEKVRSLAHELAGTSGMLGLPMVREVCEGLESAAREGLGRLCIEISEHLQAELDRGLGALRSFMSELGGPADDDGTRGKTRLTHCTASADLLSRAPALAETRDGQEVESVERGPAEPVLGGDTIRVVLAEDHHLVRTGLIAILRSLHDVEIVGEACDGHELLAIVDALKPDVVLCDVGMPNLDGIAATAVITAQHPGVRVLVLSASKDAAVVRSAVANGASGYLGKDTPATELAQALRTVVSGSVYYSPSIAHLLLRSEATQTREPKLTPRQRQVLALLASGKSSKEVAFELGLSSKTVDAHRAKIMEQLEIRTTAGLIRYALHKGIVGAD